MRATLFIFYLFVFFTGWAASIALGWLFWQVRNGSDMVRNLALVFCALALAYTSELIANVFVRQRQTATWEYGALFWTGRALLDIALVWCATSLIRRRKNGKAKVEI